jgi:hypothetical protein
MRDWLNAFNTQIQSSQRKRVNFEQLLFNFLSCRPELAEHPERLQHLQVALEDLAEQGHIELPRGNSAWTKIATGRYPKWILVKKETPQVAVSAAEEPWIKELSFCSTFTNQTQLKAAQAINRFLISHRHDLIAVPMRERSLQIFGDEKKLDGMVKNSHLFDGRLPLSTIGALEIPHFLVHTIFKRAAQRHNYRSLVVENHHTYWSICQWNASANLFDAVIYGAGLFFQKSEMFLDEISSQEISPEYFYFGDIDPAGFDIPLSINRRRIAESRPVMRAYMPFYRWTLENGYQNKNASSKQGLADFEQLSAFTDNHFAVLVKQLLSEGLRIPQESLGLEILLSGVFDC